MTVRTLEVKLALLCAAGLYEIKFRNAGVGCAFYEGPRGVDGWVDRDAEWRPFLKVYGYHPTLSAAVDAELQRLGHH